MRSWRDCDSGVFNYLVDGDTGCTISDLISDCILDVRNQGGIVSAVTHVTNDLHKDGFITKAERKAIQSCAKEADIF